MPKHMIYPLPNPDGTDADRRLEIHWQPRSGVQLGSSVFSGAGDRNQDYTDSGAEMWPGQFVELDRAQVNHLIRYLRQARDQAFGKDE